ncbi:MAG TPA: DUF4058 family protein [Tepidisphaeraceae bacterium]|nr:DUF4058 family protein [Tepidisphaeraceae bacterium]
MKSPFPGMDPYLEPHWRDVHTALIAEARRALNRVLPAGLVARAEEQVAVESGGNLYRRVGPDVRVFSQPTEDVSEGGTGVTIEAPFKLVVESDPPVDRDIRIIDEAGQVVTILEFISPWNKRQPGLDEFREKRANLLAGRVHVIEVDLVRAGNWRALMRPEICPPDGTSIYRAVIRTHAPRIVGYLFPIHLCEPLPSIPIPLRDADKPVQLVLQQLLDAVYEDGRYDQTLNYAEPLDPPLSDKDAGWVQERLSKLGR